jgi:hypothetical protein
MTGPATPTHAGNGRRLRQSWRRQPEVGQGPHRHPDPAAPPRLASRSRRPGLRLPAGVGFPAGRPAAPGWRRVPGGLGCGVPAGVALPAGRPAVPQLASRSRLARPAAAAAGLAFPAGWAACLSGRRVPAGPACGSQLASRSRRADMRRPRAGVAFPAGPPAAAPAGVAFPAGRPAARAPWGRSRVPAPQKLQPSQMDSAAPNDGRCHTTTKQGVDRQMCQPDDWPFAATHPTATTTAI